MGHPQNLKSYADAEKLFNSWSPWRGSVDRPWHNPKHNKKRMRRQEDGRIEFEYKGHVFATWHPNGELTVCAFDTPQQDAVFQHLLPGGFEFELAIRTGGVGMSAPLKQVRKSDWGWERFPRWVNPDDPTDFAPRWNNRNSNPDIIVFRCEDPVVLAINDGMWRPVNEDALQPFEWAEIDKKASKKLNAEYKLSDFDAYMKAINTLGELPPRKGRISERDMLTLIKEGEFAEALAHFPTNHTHGRYRYSYGQQQKEVPAFSYMSDLRTELYKMEGILIERREKLINLPEYRRIQSLLYRFS